MNIWSHRFSQNMNQYVPHNRADILTILGSYFGRNDDFIIFFWNLLTFSIPSLNVWYCMLDHLTSGSFSKPRADFYWLQLQWLYSTDVLEDSQWAQYLFEVLLKCLIPHISSSKCAKNNVWSIKIRTIHKLFWQILISYYKFSCQDL